MSASTPSTHGRRDLWLAIAALLGFLAVAAGAFGAHGLAGKVSARDLAAFETAARYQMYHALALLVLGALADRLGGRWLAAAGWLFVGGTLVFSGSLYLLVLTGARWLGAITPLGGLALLGGWLALGVAVLVSARRRPGGASP